MIEGACFIGQALADVLEAVGSFFGDMLPECFGIVDTIVVEASADPGPVVCEKDRWGVKEEEEVWDGGTVRLLGPDMTRFGTVLTDTRSQFADIDDVSVQEGLGRTR